MVIDPCESRAGDSDCGAHANSNTSRSSTSTGRLCVWLKVWGNLDAYRIPTIGTTSHDTGRWEDGCPWLQGLNSGDAAGGAYMQVARRLDRPGAALASLPPAAWQAVERAYATIEITDSVAQMGGHQVALVRGYSGRLQGAIDALERDVVNQSAGYHETTAILDKVAALWLVARRGDMAANQLLSGMRSSSFSRGASDNGTVKPRR